MSVQHGRRQQADREVPHANDEPEQTSADRRDGGKDRRGEKRDRGGAAMEEEAGGRQETLHTELLIDQIFLPQHLLQGELLCAAS